MSAHATGWVYRHSPYVGVPFAVHLALADSANDMHDNELWATHGWIAAKARTTRKTAQGAIAQMVADGLLELVEENPGEPNRYRLLMPTGAAEVWTPRRRKGVTSGDTLTAGGVTPGDTHVSREVTGGVTPGDTPIGTQGNPIKEPNLKASEVDVPETAREGWDEAAALCEFLADVIAESAPDSKRPNVTRAWITSMERLVRLDEHPPDTVRRAIEWAHRGPGSIGNGNGWAGWGAQVLSPDALRRHWDKMQRQAQQSRNGGGTALDAVRRAAAR